MPAHLLASPLAHPDRTSAWRQGHDDAGQPVHERAATAAQRAAGPLALTRECELLCRIDATRARHPRVVQRAGHAVLMLDDHGDIALPERCRAGPIPLDEALPLLIDLCASLQALHEQGLAHPGLCAEAVMCPQDGSPAFLLDLALVHPSPEQVRAGPTEARLLGYTAPERTGRTAQPADARADLYALGVLACEVLTGERPFPEADPLALLHAHMAIPPRPPISRVPTLPEALSDIVLRLLAKRPDERYQSAQSLAEDLGRCLRAWRAGRHIPAFELGRHDVRAQPLDGGVFHGRHEARSRLLDGLQCVVQQASAPASLMLVSGPAGIGKTALVRTLASATRAWGGHFIQGKFDPLIHERPFEVWAHALRDLVHQLLPGDALKPAGAALPASLASALQAHADVLNAFVPDMHLLLGPQRAPAALGPAETLNRLHSGVSALLQAVAQPHRPLVLFFDDLQWADEATLALLLAVLRTPPDGPLLVVLATRPAPEGGLPPPVDDLLQRSREAGLPAPAHLALEPLPAADVRDWLADLLQRDDAELADLAQAVHDKTGGNPWFVQEFLRALRHDGLLQVDARRGGWHCAVHDLRQRPATDNVIDLTAQRIAHLPAATRALLTVAGCLGHAWPLDVLADAAGQSPAACASGLEPALDAELLHIDDDSPTVGRSGLHALAYRFAHDRIQQAAYAALTPLQRGPAHLAIGRRLHRAAHPMAVVLPHLNLGRQGLQDDAERRELMHMNQQAARDARRAGAHATALTHLDIALNLMREADWAEEHALCLDLQLEAAEALCLCGQLDAASPRYAALRCRAANDLEAARVLASWVVQCERLSRFEQALTLGHEALALLGEPLPQNEPEQGQAMVSALTALSRLQQARPDEALDALPVMRDARLRLTLSVLVSLWSPAYITGQGLLARLISATLVRLSLTHGHAPESAYGYVTHAITMGPFLGDHRGAHALGELALAVNERFDDGRLHAKVLQQFQAHVAFWMRPYAEVVHWAHQAQNAGLQHGDHLYAAYAMGSALWAELQCGRPLDEWLGRHTGTVAAIERLESRGFADLVRMLFHGVFRLRGEGLDEALRPALDMAPADFASRHGHNRFFMGLTQVHALEVACLLDEPAEAARAARAARPALDALLGTVWPVLHAFWEAFTDLRQAPPDAADAQLIRARQTLTWFETLADLNPANFAVPRALLQAEHAVQAGDPVAARHWYDMAREQAEQGQDLRLLALATERQGLLALSQGQRANARALLGDALATWSRWGAVAKVARLRHAHAGLWLSDPAPPRAHPAPDAHASPWAEHPLDRISLIRASQSMASETDADGLLRRLLALTLEMAGATHCQALQLDEDGQVLRRHMLQARPQDAHEERGLVDAAAMSSPLPWRVVSHVRQSHAPLVLVDASRDERFAFDPAVATLQMRSVLALPIASRGQSLGVLLLENRLMPGAFDDTRVRLVDVLVAQAAIALDNAELVAGLRREVQQRREASHQLAAALGEVQRLTRDLEAENTYLRRDLIANLSHDLRTPLAAVRGYLEVVLDKGPQLAPETQQDYLGIAWRQTRYLGELTDQLLDLAKLDFRGMTVQAEPLKLSELAFDVLQKFELTATERRVALTPDLVTNDPLIQADASLIERVLDNLIGNALQHTPAGGRVTLRMSLVPQGVRVAVSDTGSGIDAAQLPHVFNRFYRGQPRGTAAGQGGAGLGLAITQRILELHGSQMAVQSAPGEGSTFSFVLPGPSADMGAGSASTRP